MPNISSLTVPVNFEITEVSKQVLRPLVTQVLAEVLEDSQALIKSEDDLRAFVQAEVRKALKDAMHEYEAEIAEKGSTTMGGKPQTSTPADRRLKVNKPATAKPTTPKPTPTRKSK